MSALHLVFILMDLHFIIVEIDWFFGANEPVELHKIWWHENRGHSPFLLNIPLRVAIANNK
jgi:hypothetical protein